LAFGVSDKNSLIRLSPYFPNSAWVMPASRFDARAALSFNWLANVEKLAWSVAFFSVFAAFSTASRVSLFVSEATGTVTLFETRAENAACNGLIIDDSLAMVEQGSVHLNGFHTPRGRNYSQVQADA